MPHQGLERGGDAADRPAELQAGGGSREPIQALAQVLGIDYDGAGLGIKQADELSGALTCNLGILRYDGCQLTAQLDIRYPLCADEVDMCGRAAMALSPWGIALTRTGGHVPLHVPADHEVVKGLLEVYHEQTGLPAYPIAIGGGTYSRTMAQYGGLRHQLPRGYGNLPHARRIRGRGKIHAQRAHHGPRHRAPGGTLIHRSHS